MQSPSQWKDALLSDLHGLTELGLQPEDYAQRWTQCVEDYISKVQVEAVEFVKAEVAEADDSEKPEGTPAIAGGPDCWLLRVDRAFSVQELDMILRQAGYADRVSRNILMMIHQQLQNLVERFRKGDRPPSYESMARGSDRRRNRRDPDHDDRLSLAMALYPGGISALAATCGLSKSSLYRICSRTHNAPPMQLFVALAEAFKPHAVELSQRLGFDPSEIGAWRQGWIEGVSA